MKPLVFSLYAAFLSFTSSAQSDIEPRSYNYGGVPLANQFYATFVVKNNGMKSEYLLKVDADNSIVYKKPSGPIEPGQTDTLRVWYNPQQEGDFDKVLKIYLSDKPEPTIVSLKGKLLKLDKDPSVNCYSFVQKQASVNIVLCNVQMKIEDGATGLAVEGASVTQYFNSKPSFTMKTDFAGTVSLSVKPNMYHYWIEAPGYESIFVDQYINQTTGVVVFRMLPVGSTAVVSRKTESKAEVKAKEENTGELSASLYASNNIVFLIDVSASMKLKDKMPLLKQSMHRLIDQLRSIDKVSIITYADDAKVVYPSEFVTDKEKLKNQIDSLVANGATAANRGLLLAQKMVTENYIEEGNNQIVIATDGSFRVKDKDMDLFERGGDGNKKNITVTILGFGNDDKGLRELKKLASRVDGHYIYITDAAMAQEALLKEIKKNSRRKK